MNNFHAVGRIAAEIKLQKNEKGVVYCRIRLQRWCWYSG